MALRITLRNLARTPVVTTVAVLSLALGMGANTAMFSVLQQVVLRTLPIQEPERLALLYAPGPLQGSVSSDENGSPSFAVPTYRGLAKSQTVFTGLAAAGGSAASLSLNGNPIRERIHLVSGNYFQVLGVRPVLGRLLTPEDDLTPGAHAVAVLGHRYWSTTLGSDPGVLNRTLHVNSFPMTIVGVTPPGFESERPGSAPAAFVTLSMRAQLVPGTDPTLSRKHHWLPVFGRLKPGMSLEKAQIDIQPAYAAEKEEEIRALTNPDARFIARYRAKQIVLREGRYGRGRLRQEARTPVFLLLGITGLVLLIACANVANLMLARAAARTREMAVRVAIGASRGQIVRQLLTESWVLATMAGIAGLVVARGTLALIAAGIPPSADVNIETRLHPAMFLFSAGLCLLTGLLFGLLPALRASRPDLNVTLKDQAGQVSGGGSANFLRRALVAMQMSASLALLIAAGLFGQSLLNLMRVELGIRTDHLALFQLDPSLNKYSDDRTLALYEELEKRLAAMPGALLVSASMVPAIGDSNWGQNVTIDGYTPDGDGADHSFFNVVGPGYLRTMGAPLVAGREFTGQDNQAGARVVMVNEAFIRKFFPKENSTAAVLGRAIGMGASKPDHTIVGVVKDTHYASIRESPKPVFYQPYRQEKRQAQLYFYVRTALPPENLLPLIRREVASLDPNLPVGELKTMDGQIEEQLFAERLLTVNIMAFAALATLLAAIGLYGVLAYGVARRTREIGIRMALGAEPGAVRAMILKEVVWMLAVGALAGSAGAFGLSRVAESLFFGLTGSRWTIYAGATALLAIIALMAALMPANRATRIHPINALRYE